MKTWQHIYIVLSIPWPTASHNIGSLDNFRWVTYTLCLNFPLCTIGKHFVSLEVWGHWESSKGNWQCNLATGWVLLQDLRQRSAIGKVLGSVLGIQIWKECIREDMAEGEIGFHLIRPPPSHAVLGVWRSALELKQVEWGARSLFRLMGHWM